MLPTRFIIEEKFDHLTVTDTQTKMTASFHKDSLQAVECVLNSLFPDPLYAKTIEQTCFACPSAWTGLLQDGRVWNVRYRWGYLTFSTEDGMDYSEKIGDEYDGSIDFDQVKLRLSHLICFNQAE